ncbi:hypothetical protein ACOMHN_004040 [Nucella lapillus]
MKKQAGGGTGSAEVSAAPGLQSAKSSELLLKLLRNQTRNGPDMFLNNKPLLRPHNVKVQVFPDWPQVKPNDNGFLLRAYLYSAFVSLHPLAPGPPPRGTQVHIVAFQEGNTLLPLKCCLRLPGQKPILGLKVQLDFSKAPVNKIDPPLRKHSTQVGVVYSCHFLYSPRQLHAASVSLTSTSCPAKGSEYLRIQEPEIRPGSLGLCAKVLFGHELDPRRLVEWFEMQRLLGVDKIVLFDLNHSAKMDKVLRYYVKSGLLLRLPYKLPDRPWGRDIRRGTTSDRWGDEQVLTTWDCRLRLAGYGFVLALDLDEVVLPRNFLYLKPYLRKEFQKPELAAIFFKVQFFVEGWGPVDRKAPLHMLQYLNSTVPWDARLKYVYVPVRTHQPLTHQLEELPGYSCKRAPPWEAILFHYRKCPFEKCEMNRITDSSMTHYKQMLVPRVLTAVRKVGLK